MIPLASESWFIFHVWGKITTASTYLSLSHNSKWKEDVPCGCWGCKCCCDWWESLITVLESVTVQCESYSSVVVTYSAVLPKNKKTLILVNDEGFRPLHLFLEMATFHAWNNHAESLWKNFYVRCHCGVSSSLNNFSCIKAIKEFGTGLRWVQEPDSFYHFATTVK